MNINKKELYVIIDLKNSHSKPNTLMPLSFKIFHIIIALMGGMIMIFAGYIFTLDELFSAVCLIGFGLLLFCFGFIPLLIQILKTFKKIIY